MRQVTRKELGTQARTLLDAIIADLVDEDMRTQPTPLRCVGLRVDWYTVAFQVEVSKAARKELRRAAADARGMLDRGGERASRRKSAPVAIGDFIGELTPRKGEGSYVVTNGIEKINVDVADSWSVVVELRAMYLARTPFLDAIEHARAVARSLGPITGERTRRADLAADVVGWTIAASDATALIGRAQRTSGRGNVADYRPGVSEFEETDDDRIDLDDEHVALDSRTYHAGRKVTGVTVCAGAPMMLRIYDKTAQLSTQKPIKREVEEERWRASPGGYHGEQVTRIEFQIRSETLREFREMVPNANGEMVPKAGKDESSCARNPDVLVGSLDSIFAYCVRDWMRLVLPGTASRLCRCDTDRRWEFLEGLRFHHKAEPSVRLRTRSGADVAGVLGSARSLAAASGLSFQLTVPPILLSNERFARWFVAGFVEATMSNAAGIAVRQLLARCCGPDDASALALELVNAHNASVARFATSPLDLAHFHVPAFVRDAMYETEEREALEADRPRVPLTYPQLVRLLEDTQRDVGLTFVDVHEREHEAPPDAYGGSRTRST